MLVTELKNTTQSTAFGVEISAEMFEIFSSKIYSRPYEAVVRELATNAADAQIEAKSKTPVKLTLPTAGSREFRIRDYGTGLAPEDFVTVYNTYLRSTKKDDKRTTGKFGLGSKSPFALTKLFNVINYYNGLKYHYVLHLENGIPRNEYMGQKAEDGSLIGYPTDEPNGLEVFFSVTDAHACIEAAKQVYRAFPEHLVPKCNIPLPRNTYIYEDDKGRYKAINYNLISHVIMGNVSYPILKNRILEGYFDRKGDVYYLLDYASLEIYVDVDDLDIPVSREELYYSPRTIERLRTILISIYDDIDNKQKELFKGVSQYRKTKMQNAGEQTGFIAKFRAVGSNYATILNAAESHCSVYDYYGYSSRGLGIRKKKNNSHSGTPILFYKDQKTKYAPIIENYILKTYGDNRYSGRTALLIEFEDNDRKKAFFKDAGVDESDFLYISKLEKDYYVAKPKATKGISALPYRRIYHLKNGSFKQTDYKPAQLENGGIYLQTGDWNFDNATSKSLAKLCKENFNQDLFVVRGELYALMENNPKWEKIEDKIKAMTAKDDEIIQYATMRNSDRRLVEFLSNILPNDNKVQEIKSLFDKKFDPLVLYLYEEDYMTWNKKVPKDIFSHIDKTLMSMVQLYITYGRYATDITEQQILNFFMKGTK